MITRAMIKAGRVDDSNSPFPNADRYRAGLMMQAEQMVAKNAPQGVHDLAKERLRMQVWDTIYNEIWLKIKLLETYSRQRRWADIDSLVSELDSMLTNSFNKSKDEE